MCSNQVWLVGKRNQSNKKQKTKPHQNQNEKKSSVMGQNSICRRLYACVYGVCVCLRSRACACVSMRTSVQRTFLYAVCNPLFFSWFRFLSFFAKKQICLPAFSFVFPQVCCGCVVVYKLIQLNLCQCSLSLCCFCHFLISNSVR